MEQLFKDVKTSAELIAQGMSSGAITRAYQQKQLHRIRYNSYTPMSMWQSWDIATRCKAHHVAVIKNRPSYVLSHLSSALWWDAPLLTLLQRIWVSTPTAGVRSRQGIQVTSGRSLICQQSTFHRGATITTPAQTVADCAKVAPLLDTLCIADFMLHRQLTPPDLLKETLLAVEGRGLRTARQVAEYMSQYAESPAETLARYRIIQWRIPKPQEQATVHVNGHRYRPDFLWEAERVILEVDGEIKYSGDYGDPHRVIQQEHRRQRELEQLGYRVIRVRWQDLMQRPQQVRYWLAQAGVR